MIIITVKLKNMMIVSRRFVKIVVVSFILNPLIVRKFVVMRSKTVMCKCRLWKNKKKNKKSKKKIKLLLLNPVIVLLLVVVVMPGEEQMCARVLYNNLFLKREKKREEFLF